MKKALGAAFAAALVAGAVAVPLSSGSSHREAPGTMLDPSADNTDTYAFVSPDAPDKATFVGNWIPGQVPANGPLFFRWDDKAFYYINIDNVGDGKAHIRYLFKFKTSFRNPNSNPYATPPVNSISDPTLNVFQTYTVTKETFKNGDPAKNRPDSSTVLARNLPVAPQDVGPKTMPNYQALSNQALVSFGNGSKVFAGPRAESFFIDLGATFDSVNVRKGTGNQGGGKDDFAGYNISSIILQVPKSDVTADGKGVSGPSAPNAVIGVWDSTERRVLQAVRTRRRAARHHRRRNKHHRGGQRSSTSVDAQAVDSRKRRKRGRRGPVRTRIVQRQVQVSRLGNPLINELVIPIGLKDKFNATEPKDDLKNFGQFVLAPEYAHLENVLFHVNAPETNRTDIVQALLTGIPGKTQIGTHPVPADTLKFNMGVPPTATPNRFGVIGGDLAGFPNGRRLGDDVVDITLQVVAGFLKGNKVPLGDGVDQNDKPFLSTFPYMAQPNSGQDSAPSQRFEPQHQPVPAGGG